jgi:hypothetical protein
MRGLNFTARRRAVKTWQWVVAATLAPWAAAVAVFVALSDHATVDSRAGLRSVSFGWPFDWLTQDQTTSSPPFPIELSASSPWENPTGVALGAFVVDFLVVYAILLAGLVVGIFLYREVTAAARRSVSV